MTVRITPFAQKHVNEFSIHPLVQRSGGGGEAAAAATVHVRLALLRKARGCGAIANWARAYGTLVGRCAHYEQQRKSPRGEGDRLVAPEGPKPEARRAKGTVIVRLSQRRASPRTHEVSS